MLYPTLNQPLVAIFIALAGLASGFLFDLAKFLLIFFNYNKVAKQILLFLACILSGFIYFVINLFVNLGQFRVFTIAIFILVLLSQRFISNKLLSKFADKISQLKLRIAKRHKKTNPEEFASDEIKK